MTANEKIELPYYMAESLALVQNIVLDIPDTLNHSVRQDMLASSIRMNLHALSPFFTLVAMKMAHL